MKVALIAGSGDLPHNVVEGAQSSGTEIIVASLLGISDSESFLVPTKSFGLAEFGKMTRYFKKNDVTHVCFAGNVNRPNFNDLKPDFKGWRKLRGAVKAAKFGDDALLRYILEIYENEGFEIIAPQDICEELLLPEGHLGNVSMTATHRDDVIKALQTAMAIGELDIGQGAVVCRGLILAVEAQEGTDRMLERVASLTADIRGHEGAREGVLAKVVKPGQEDRVDLPTIGVATIEKAAKAGLAGIVAESGQAFIIGKEKVIKAADQAGLFIAGLPASKHGE